MSPSDMEKKVVNENLNRIVKLIDSINKHHQSLVEKLEEVLLIDGKVVNQEELDLIQKNNYDIQNKILYDIMNRIN